MSTITTAIIGGSGVTDCPLIENGHYQVVRTPYGDPSAPFLIGEVNGVSTVFIQRHGVGHSIPPHKVNYRANCWALQSLGVQRIFAIAATGGIQADLVPETLVIPHQMIDYTYGREHTYFDRSKNQLHHIDFTQPYSEYLRQILIRATKLCGVSVVNEGIYAATQGPRLESAAEIDRYERDGATIVGMTGMPEAALARELEIDYSCLSMVVNLAAGRSASEISLEAIKQHMQAGMSKVVEVLRHSITN